MHLGDNHPDVIGMQEYYNNLLDQYQGQINLKILAKLAMGQAFEKMEKYDNAIREFRIGT
jgi:AICAR transformylase/IMP cyclohydrolase PurH